MTKRLDPDIKVLRACVRALDCSSSLRMLRANMEYLWDRYMRHPSRESLARIMRVSQPARRSDE
jgi:hypothetical protein